MVGSIPPTQYYKVIDTVHNIIKRENGYVSINEKGSVPTKSLDKLTNRVIETNGEVDNVYQSILGITPTEEEDITSAGPWLMTLASFFSEIGAEGSNDVIEYDIEEAVMEGVKSCSVRHEGASRNIQVSFFIQ